MRATKDPTRRQRRNKPKPPAIVRVGGGEVPDPPAGLLAPTRKAWTEFWSTQLATHMQVTDLPALRRLFMHYDELDRIEAALKPRKRAPLKRRADETYNDFEARKAARRREQQASDLLVHEPKGGHRLNPLLRYRLDVEATVNALEDRFGLSLASRQKIGLAQLKAQTLAESNAKTIAAPGDTDDSDPRAVLRIDQAKSRRKPARPKGAS